MKNRLTSKQALRLVLSLLGLFFIAALILVFNTENSFGGGDHFTHFKLARWGWSYPKLLFSHWGKPVFTLLISPFAQLGIDAARLFNVLTGLATAFLAWKLARELRFKNSLLVIFFVLLVPVYFSLMFSVMTEVLHSLFLVLAVWLFFKKEYNWSAVAVSFLPIVRTESVVLIPLFLLAFGLKKQWRAIPFMVTGFLIISLAGWHFYNGFWWLVTEMPYKGSAAGIYGHGTLFHFINHTKGILGYPIAGLFYVGLLASLWFWYKKDAFKVTDRFYFLLLVPGVYLTFLAAHSFVWWKGLGNSLGLIRVMGSVTPMVAVTALVGFNFIEDLFSKYKKLFAGFALILFLWMMVMLFSVCRRGFKRSAPQVVLKQATDYVKINHLDRHKVYYFNNYVPFQLGINPYNNQQSSWGIPASAKVSVSIPDSSIIVWDAHFGPNEGRTPLKKLLNDNGLEVLKVFEPERPFKVLGGYNYQVYIFQKTGSSENGLNLTLDFEGDEPENSAKRAFAGKKSHHVGRDKTFLNLMVNQTANLCSDSCLLTLSGELFTIEGFAGDDVSLVVSCESEGADYFYRAFSLDKVAQKNRWAHFDYKLKLSPPQGSDEIMKVYFWNKNRKEFWIDDVKLHLAEIN